MARILLVDDDPDFVEIIRLTLQAEGHEIISASDGQQAMAKMHEAKPSLVLLDVMMSYVLDGLQVSQEMQQDPLLADVPIIMISSIAGSPYAGMFPTNEYIPINEWISKPVDPKDLAQRVAKYV